MIINKKSWHYKVYRFYRYLQYAWDNKSYERANKTADNVTEGAYMHTLQVSGPVALGGNIVAYMAIIIPNILFLIWHPIVYILGIVSIASSVASVLIICCIGYGLYLIVSTTYKFLKSVIGLDDDCTDTPTQHDNIITVYDD